MAGLRYVETEKGVGGGVDVGLVACVLVAVLTREREPSYGESGLSEWVAICDSGPSRVYSADEWDMADDAIRHIGTNSLPLLLAWIDYQPPAWKERLRSIVNTLPNWIQRATGFLTRERRANKQKKSESALPFSVLLEPQQSRSWHAGSTRLSSG